MLIPDCLRRFLSRSVPLSTPTDAARRRFLPCILGLSATALATGAARADRGNLATLPINVPDGVAGLDALGVLHAQLVKSTGSLTFRALQDRFAECINVKDFGATGEGTVDDTAAIQASHAAAAALGLPLFLPPGTYNVTGLVSITQPIIGWSRFNTKVVLVTSGINHLLRLADGVTGWSIREVTLDSQSNGLHGLSSHLATNIDIRRCQILNSGLCGIYITNAVNAVIEDCFINNSGSGSNAASARSGAGISVYACDGAIRKNTITNSGGANITGGSYIPSGDMDGYLDIDDNYCSNAGSVVKQDNITLYDSANARIRVRDNRCIKSVNHNIHVGGLDVEIRGNQCYDAAQNNILCSSRIAGTQILAPFVGGTVDDNTCDTAGLNNIGLDGVSQCTVSRNKCRHATGSGIVSLLSSINLEIIGNTINSPNSAGILIGGMIDGVVALNTITSPGMNCIQIHPSEDLIAINALNTSITNNTLHGGKYAVWSTDNGSLIVALNISTSTASNANPFNVLNSTLVFGNFGGAQAQGLTWGSAVGASSSYGSAIGYQALTKIRYGFHAVASGILLAQGDAQGGKTVLRGSTGSGTTCTLTADGSPANAHNIVNLVTGSVIKIAGDVLVRDSVGNCASFNIRAAAKNNGGKVSIVGAPIVTSDAADSAASSWTVSVTADATNFGFKILVTAVSDAYADAFLAVTELVH